MPAAPYDLADGHIHTLAVVLGAIVFIEQEMNKTVSDVGEPRALRLTRFMLELYSVKLFRHAVSGATTLP